MYRSVDIKKATRKENERKGLSRKCDPQIPLGNKTPVVYQYSCRLSVVLPYAFPEVYCDFICLISQENTNSQTSARHWSMDKTHCLSMQSSMSRRRSTVLSNLEVSILRVSSDSE